MADPILIDARDLLCPLPVLRLRKALDAVAPDTVVELLATDPAAHVDVPHFCAEQGHRLVETITADQCTRFLVQKSA